MTAPPRRTLIKAVCILLAVLGVGFAVHKSNEQEDRSPSSATSVDSSRKTLRFGDRADLPSFSPEAHNASLSKEANDMLSILSVGSNAWLKGMNRAPHPLGNDRRTHRHRSRRHPARRSRHRHTFRLGSRGSDAPPTG